MNTRNLGIIGLGNMGMALLDRLIAVDFPHFEKYYIYDLLKEKTQLYENQKKVQICNDEKEVMQKGNYVFFAVKPQVIANLLKTLKESNPRDKIIISILAGTPIETFIKELGVQNYYIRAMPNIAFQIGEGAAGVALDSRLDKDRTDVVKELFNVMGTAVFCEEKDLDVITGLSGSGPAYFFMILEAMADGAVKMGLSRDKAYKLAAQTAIGAGKMLLTGQKHPGQLKDMVTSPAGTTIEAISVLEKVGIRSALIEAVEAATKRAQMLKPK
jgi:pyrroline-5-carboxylate reductase